MYTPELGRKRDYMINELNRLQTLFLVLLQLKNILQMKLTTLLG